MRDPPPIVGQIPILDREDLQHLRECRKAIDREYRVQTGGITATAARLMPRSGKMNTFQQCDWIAQFNDMYLEIFDTAVLVHWPKAVTPDEALACVRFCDGILQRLCRVSW